MGILDWLSDAIGGSGSMLPPDQTTGGLRPTPAQTFQRPEFTGPQGGQPPMPMPPPGGGIGSDAARAPMQPPLPPGPQPTGPMPPVQPMDNTGGQAPVSAGTDFGTPGWSTKSPMPPPPPPGDGAKLPPGATSTNGVDAPGAIKSYQAAGGTMMTPGSGDIPVAGAGPQGNGAKGFLDRALGIDANTKRTLTGGLAAGLTAAGNSSGKSPFQAFASGAGATLSGGDAADDKTELKQERYLKNAMEAVKTGDERELNLARTKLLEAQTKMTAQGKFGKDSVMNSDAQLYLRAVGATNSDGPLKLLRKAYDDAVATGGAASPAAKAAKDAYDSAYKSTLDSHLGRLGLDPKTADKIGKQPGMSQDNPVPKTQLTSQEAFDKLPPGSFFVNPKDGKILQKPMAPVAPGQQPAGRPGGTTLPAGQGGVPAPTGPNLPPLPPSAPTKPVASLGYDSEAETDDEKEAA